MKFVRFFFKRSLVHQAAQADAPPERKPKQVTAADGAESWFYRGQEHLAAGRLEDAAAALARAIDLRHDYTEALVAQALVFKRQGRIEDANDNLLLAEHLRPDLADVHFQLGLLASGQEAEDRFRKALAADPGHFMSLNALGALLFKRGALEEAVECFRRVIALEPRYALAHSNLGYLLATFLDEFNEGAEHIEIAWQLKPYDATVMCNWAGLLQQRGQLPEALALWTQIVDKGGEDADKARLNRALVLLKQGEFERGWSDYEARKRTDSEYRPQEFPYPEWKDEPIDGCTVLVHAEQGIGDQIMFASCIPDLMRRAGHCVVECAHKLEAIFRRSFPAATVRCAQQDTSVRNALAGTPSIDYQVALGSLPLHFRKAAADFPAHDGYLRADPGKVAAWRKRLEGLPARRRIGISWRGGVRRTRQAMRSLPLASLLPILTCTETVFVSLQYTDCAAEISQVERDHGVRVFHWQEAIDDYDETAALVFALDLVISVQTSIVHLSGALGRPAWVMVPAVAEWRYLDSGERMWWYPSVRIWRQDRPDEWQPVVERVEAALRAFEPHASTTTR